MSNECCCSEGKMAIILEKVEETNRLVRDLIEKVEKLDGIRGFGSNVLANIVGDIITRKQL